MKMTLIETIFKKIADAIYKDSGVRIYIEHNVDDRHSSRVKAEYNSKRFIILEYTPAYDKIEFLEWVLFGYSYDRYYSMSLFDILKFFQHYAMQDKNEIMKLTDVEFALGDSMLCKKLSGIRKCDSVEELVLEMDLIGI